ncbi:malate synthase A [Pseudomonadota bacterium]
MNLSANHGSHPELELTQALSGADKIILTADAMSFLAELADRFTPELKELLAAREQRQLEFDGGAVPGFDPSTSDIRAGDWQVAPIPADIADRRTEITGPVTRKMVINALNSGAQVYMADFEDSTAPTWSNVIDGQVNLRDAIRRQIDFSTAEGKSYSLNEKIATLMVRPRGLHLPERHIKLAGQPVHGALVDFGLFLFHNHAELLKRGGRPYFYIPKLQHYSEAVWWEKVMAWSEQKLGMEHGTVRVTLLIETLPAVFQMHEILYALKDRILGLNCGRWDYIFSYIKTFRNHPDRVLPDRDQVGMTVPFLASYSKLLIQTCHAHGAFAMGGMAAQIPIRGNDEANSIAMEKVRVDKEREAGNGHDGTWVAHPGLEPLSRAEFDKILKGPNQIDRKLADFTVNAEDLIAPSEGSITEAGVRKNIRVAIQYLAAWLSGNGCVPIDNLMEDAATAEIGRTQLWQWVKQGAELDDGRKVTQHWLDGLFEEEKAPLLAAAPESFGPSISEATALLQRMTSNPELDEFLTLPAYEQLND